MLFESSIGDSCDVNFFVESYESPIVSWTSTSGGKLGTWNIAPLSKHTYAVNTSIVPYQDSHIGKYMARIRNDVGRLDIDIHLVRKKINTCY